MRAAVKRNGPRLEGAGASFEIHHGPNLSIAQPYPDAPFASIPD